MGIRRLIDISRRAASVSESDITARQRALCIRLGASHLPVRDSEKLGISRGLLEEKKWPLHGVRMAPEAGTCGWYLWTGDHDANDPDFFVPVHAKHLLDTRPDVGIYLGLPPGWRFLIAPNHEDCWFDQEVIQAL
ncbi:immunity protein Imm33 domain-containing protein [Streptomyces katrae]|uniref:immunity protein Imm33 domain-containing protein n=1 Tax=Streptomyces katrae TaxID=68223 RepID=UPI003DA7B86A